MNESTFFTLADIATRVTHTFWDRQGESSSSAGTYFNNLDKLKSKYEEWVTTEEDEDETR